MAAVNVYVPAADLERLKAAGLDLSRIAREAWARALAAQSERVAEYGPHIPRFKR